MIDLKTTRMSGKESFRKKLTKNNEIDRKKPINSTPCLTRV
jgi:hypothetical protein